MYRLDFGGQGSKVKVAVTSDQFHAHEHSISGTLQENLFKFGKNVHLDPKMN